jgi:hypothetical protein
MFSCDQVSAYLTWGAACSPCRQQSLLYLNPTTPSLLLSYAPLQSGAPLPFSCASLICCPATSLSAFCTRHRYMPQQLLTSVFPFPSWVHPSEHACTQLLPVSTHICPATGACSLYAYTSFRLHHDPARILSFPAAYTGLTCTAQPVVAIPLTHLIRGACSCCCLSAGLCQSNRYTPS